MDLTYAGVAETGIWLRNRNRPPEPEALRPRGILNNDLTLYFVIAILAAPVNFAALESYRDRYPLTTLAWFLWGFYVSIAIQMLIQRREKIIRLLGELELKSRLAAVGEVTARIAHQTRHELGIAGMSLHQIEKQLGPLPPENREAVMKELGKLGQVRDDLSRMLTGVLKSPDSAAEPVPMKSFAAIVRAEAEHIRPRAVSAGIGVEVRVEGSACEIRSPKDTEKFSQALFNLVDNAVAAARRQVVVTAAARPEGIVVRVEDDGSGIPAHLLTEVIKPFFSTRPNGTGMGLSVAKAVAEEEGGRLELKNRPGGGLEAAIWLA
jgi:signal transduction histidine kinase